MSHVAVRAERVGKRYRIGTNAGYKTLRDSVTHSVRRLFGRGASDRSANEFWALDDISFEIRQGEAVGLIGRNGAGKSTLLKILSRITEPTRGQIELNGRVGSLLEVGTGFHPELTGRENIFLNGAILGMQRSEIQRKFDAIVAFAEVERFLDTPVRHYSSGMYMRLAFAVAAHLEPEILLVDEVLAVGDAAFQKKCLGKMGDVASEGRTIVFVSHNMGAVNRLCRQSIWLDGGRVIDQGPTGEVVSRYLAKDSSNQGARVWPEGTANRGVSEFKLFSFRLLNDKGQITSSVDMRSPFFVTFEYRLDRPLSHFRAGFVVSTADGTIIFDTYDADVETNRGRREAGTYHARCEVPGHLLLPGTYLLSFNAGTPGLKNLLYMDNVLSFTIEPTVDFGDVNAVPVGFIRPKLKWESQNS